MTLPPASSFNGLDWALLLLLAVSTVLAFLRGIIKAALSLIGLTLGVVVAAWYYQPVAQVFSRVMPDPAVARVAAFLLLVVAVMLACTVLGNALRRTVRVVGLGALDRLLGAAFGLARGCLLGSVLLMSLAAFLPDTVLVRGSRLAPYFLAGAHAVSSIVPQRMQQQISAGASQLLRQTPEILRARPLSHQD